jgi:hypothetical protein
MRLFLFCTALLSVSGAVRAETVYRFDVVNASTHAIATVAVAPAGGSVFRRAVGESGRPTPLGCGESMTITTHPSEGGCLRDLRVAFDNGQESIERNFDICRNGASYRAH